MPARQSRSGLRSSASRLECPVPVLACFERYYPVDSSRPGPDRSQWESAVAAAAAAAAAIATGSGMAAPVKKPAAWRQDGFADRLGQGARESAGMGAGNGIPDPAGYVTGTVGADGPGDLEYNEATRAARRWVMGGY